MLLLPAGIAHEHRADIQAAATTQAGLAANDILGDHQGMRRAKARAQQPAARHRRSLLGEDQFENPFDTFRIGLLS